MRGLEEIEAYNNAFIAHRADYRRHQQRAEAAAKRSTARYRPVEKGSGPGDRLVILHPVLDARGFDSDGNRREYW